MSIKNIFDKFFYLEELEEEAPAQSQVAQKQVPMLRFCGNIRDTR